MADETEYVTNRGFSGYLEMIDSYGSVIRVQQSSAAFEAHCWLWVQAQENPPPGALTEDGSAHLSLPQARRVHAALGAFIADAERWIEEGLYDE